MARLLLQLLLLAAAGVDSAALKPRQDNFPKPGEPMCVGPGGKVPDPEGAAPRKVSMKSTGSIAEAQRVKMRYGPWNVPNMMIKNIVGEGGSLWNCGDMIEKPCEECTILRMIPNLEYANGSTANIDTGIWLHHVLLYTVGPTRWDPTCTGQDSAPHVAVGSTADKSERSFAAGNERTPTDFTEMRLGGKKTGYHVTKEDHFRILVDFMNMNMDNRTIYFTVEWDYIDGPLKTAEWMDLKPVWLDIDLCGLSDVKAPKNSGAFSIEGKPWIPNFEGDIVGLGGHLHDGGTSLQFFTNPGTEVCNSVAKYAETPEFIFHQANNTSSEGGHSHIAEKHISSMSQCYNQIMPVRKLQKSQNWVLKGNYNFDIFAGNTEEDGKQQDVMGLALMYVAVPPGGVPAPK